MNPPQRKKQTDSPLAISPQQFLLMVEDSIPYTGYVYGIGNVNHKPDTFFVVRRSCKPAPDQEEMDWFNRVSQEAPLPLTLTSIYLDLKAYNIWNEKTWVTASGKRKTFDVFAKNPVTGKYINPGVQGERIGYELARKRSLPFKRLGTATNAAVVVLAFADIGKNGANGGNTLDLIFGTIAFVPKVGWVISGVYSVADYVVYEKTGKKIGNHLEDFLFEKYVAFENMLRGFLRSLSPPMGDLFPDIF